MSGATVRFLVIRPNDSTPTVIGRFDDSTNDYRFLMADRIDAQVELLMDALTVSLAERDRLWERIEMERQLGVAKVDES